jgi:hypothetical protein
MSKTIEIDGVSHRDTRTIRDKIFDDGWKVPRNKPELPNQTELDALSANMAKDKWEAEYFNPGTSIDRKEQMRLQREQDQYLDAREREQTLREHLSSPRIARKLSTANEIRAAIVADSERLVSDIIRADRVIATYSDPEGDVEAADKMLRELTEHENNYRLDRANEIRKQRDELERRFQATIAGLRDTDSPIERIRVVGTDATERIDDLASKMAVAPGYTFEQLDEVHRARRAVVLTGDTSAAETALAKYADMRPEQPQGLEVTSNE